MEESNKKQDAFDECIRKFKDYMDLNLRMLDDATKNLQVRAEQLTQATQTNNMVDKAKTKMRKDLVLLDLPNDNPKKPIVENDTVRLDDRYSTTLQNQPAPKENDSGSFTLHCLISNLNIKSALADLGASINVMPFSTFKRLQIGNLQPTNMMVEMVDMTMKAPWGIIKNLLVQIEKFTFPLDFVIMDMVEGLNVPLILGRPILATAHAQIYVFNKQISHRIGEERNLFKMNELMDYITYESVYMIKCSRKTHEEELKLLLASDPQSPFAKMKAQ
uniref:Reverse transcriptase domain-containing protein n=1 Tax=Tanacetum cinerariifolium TaxID=118510 RepID=A0A6L2L8I4_TANCI|nr:hypothetical protein [Tanacetum cinerariifolium]